ncbi:MAG: prepilin-type N-terminal cleavage/methylation domain-containing protein [Nitrospirae bacterium]|nr:prepilin-type N-terminal cleavage/methylation domain-containing protein [Nitrospirota bacterium]
MADKDEKGFTLIELVLTVVIVSILGAVVSLSMSSLSTTRVDQAINKMVGDLRYAQQLAISTQSRHGITIDSLLQYSIHEDCGVDAICGNADDSAVTGGGTDTFIRDPINLGQNFIVNFDTYQQLSPPQPGPLSGVRFAAAAPFCGGAGATMEFNSIGAPTDTSGNVLNCASIIAFAGSTRTITIQQNTGNLTY